MEPLELGSILRPDPQKPRVIKPHEVRSLILSQISKLDAFHLNLRSAWSMFQDSLVSPNPVAKTDLNPAS